MLRLVPRLPMLALAALTLVTTGACASGGSINGARTSASAEQQQVIQGPHVPSGTTVHVRLTQPLDLASSAEGATLEAIVADDLLTPRGDVLVRSGSTLRGRVAWSARTGRITIRDASISSPVGPLAVRAQLIDTGQPEGSAGSDLRIAAPDAPRTATPLAREAGGSNWADAPRGRIACDTMLSLRLTRAIIAPGASVVGQ